MSMSANPLVDVIIPTCNHGPTLLRAVESVLGQTFQDFRIVIVGDGVSLEHATLIAQLCADDARIQFVANPKGAGHGEVHRARVLEDSRATYVCYLGDDDLWLPHHLETLVPLLEKYDFVHTLHTEVAIDGTLSANAGRIDDVETRRRLRLIWNYFGPTCVGHRMDAYRRLPFGWRPRPDGMPSDLYMWQQWIALPNCLFYASPHPTTLHFASPSRQDMSLNERCAELDQWSQRLREENFSVWLLQEVMADWQRRFLPPVSWRARIPQPLRRVLKPVIRDLRKWIEKE
ncbi:MAG: hypothetical protein CMK45_12965 [Porticoccus sp.]|nr:hypothetical protein [Porticoccus sp.]|tara:strand:+ start:105393 stop:106256 length:864 start_codon:yes stop_codon:yes gene_type:complete